MSNWNEKDAEHSAAAVDNDGSFEGKEHLKGTPTTGTADAGVDQFGVPHERGLSRQLKNRHVAMIS